MDGVTWKERRYIRGLRCKNAGISLSTAEIDFLDREAGAISSALEKKFSRTALVRYVLEKHYGEEWKDVVESARQEATSDPVPRKNPPGVRGRPRKTSSTTSSTTSETSTVDDTPTEPGPEPALAT